MYHAIGYTATIAGITLDEVPAGHNTSARGDNHEDGFYPHG